MVHKSYFTFKELVTTDTDFPNYPSTWEHIVNLVELESVLTNIREQFGEPIIVNSAFRTPEVNAAVKGSKNSYHLQGRAADIRPSFYPSTDYKDNFQRLVDVIKQHEHYLTEVIYYPTFIHIAI